MTTSDRRFGAHGAIPALATLALLVAILPSTAIAQIDDTPESDKDLNGDNDAEFSKNSSSIILITSNGYCCIHAFFTCFIRSIWVDNHFLKKFEQFCEKYSALLDKSISFSLIF